MDVFCPRRIEDLEAVNFLQQLYHFKDSDELCIDFNNLTFSFPFATLLIAVGIRNLIKYRRSNGLITKARGHKKSTSAITYLKHFGFFKFIYFNEGKDPNQATGNHRYLPITILREKDILSGELKLQDSIDKESDRLSRIIFSGRKNEGRALMFSYCLREIVRNVFEHADTKSCYVMAQRWSDGIAEIAIADQGVGLSESLSWSHPVEDAQDAISLAIKPGITSDDSQENDDKWQNSGFGLFVTSQLGLKYGEFALGSDNAILFVSQDGESWNDVPLSGTVVKLRVNTEDADYFPNILSQIVKEGEAIAKTIKGAKKSASKMSMILDLTW